MLKKAFETKKEINDFKSKYSKVEINTDVISNILQPSNINEFPVISSYCDFWWPTDKSRYCIIQEMKFIINIFAKYALEENFGKYDFSFIGNRKYEIYVLSFESSLFIVPTKREIVLEKNVDELLVEKVIKFEDCFSNMVMSFIVKNYDKLEKEDQKVISTLKNLNIIDNLGSINYVISNKNKNKLN